jgi:hypothetical protein
MTSALTYRGPALAELHERYAKQHRVDPMAPIRARREIIIDAPVERVWARLSDVPSWGTNLEPGVKNITLERGVSVDGSFVRSNKGARMRATFAVVQPNTEIAWTGSAFGVKVVHRFELTPVNTNATKVVVEESMAGSLLALLFSTRKLVNVLDLSLATLKTAAEPQP